MRIQLNGSPQDIEDGATIADVLARLDLPRDGVAVAVDRAVVPRTEHGSTVLRDGALVEVIRAVGGG